MAETPPLKQGILATLAGKTANKHQKSIVEKLESIWDDEEACEGLNSILGDMEEQGKAMAGKGK